MAKAGTKQRKIVPGYDRGELTVLRAAAPEEIETLDVRRAYNETRSVLWLVQCSCGNRLVMSPVRLASRCVKSCGCKRRFGVCNKTVTDPDDMIDAARRHAFTHKRAISQRRRNLSFTLTYDEFKVLSAQNCHYCGTKPANVSKVPPNYHSPLHRPFVYSGLDRVNSDIGYESGNVVPCCAECNQAKSDMTTEEFRAWIKRIYNHYINNG